LTLIGLVILTVLLVNLTPVQNYMARKGAEILADKLKTKVTVSHIRVDFLNHLLIQGLYIEDQKGDTLLYAGEARVRITDWFILRKEVPVLRYVGLHDAFGRLNRTAQSNKWNYQFIIDAFDTGKKDTTKKQNEFELDLEKVDIENVRFYMDDGWVGSDLNLDIGNLQLNADNFDIKKKIIDVSSLEIARTIVTLRDYVGGKPKSPRKKTRVIDTTAFNTAGWAVKLDELELKDCKFNLTSDEEPPVAHEFDPTHIYVKDINVDASKITIVGDTIRGKVKQLAGTDRCGLMIKKMSADVTVSPNATICENLYLETNNSKLRDYYAMHYERFPDFTDYINKVVMVGRLKNSVVSSGDIAYFAPVLREHPTMLRISGNITGTVSKLKGTSLNATDGTSSLKGQLAITGLPDINNAFIEMQQGSLYTTGEILMKYIPVLRDNPNVAVEKLSYLYYQGDFTGYIQNFTARGLLQSNLGNLQSDIQLQIPEGRDKFAHYSGTVSTVGFALGTLLRQDILGGIAFNAKVSGVAFDPEHAAVNLNATIPHFEVNGYSYKNITAEGVLEKKKFNGKLLVDDPNLALAFNGGIDFSQDQMAINATANVLKSDLQALKITKDSVLATADFDLNYVGNSIDDFAGYAKLYNINVVRNNHRLDVDSVYVNSSIDDGQKLLVIESNDLAAKIKGNYQLTSLPASVQYYISGYLPNYIQAPANYAPDQTLVFNVVTRQIDSLLGVLIPNVKGFNDAKISGSLNTSAQTLVLNATIPDGTIDQVHLTNVTIEGKGNFRQLNMKVNAEELVLGNDVLSASVAVNTTLGNDSLSFNIATTSPDAFGTANIGGNAIARGDSLYLRMQPSEFFLNNTRWEIPSGNYLAFATNYLMIRDLTIRSEGQQISVFTEDEYNSQSLAINIKDLNLKQLGDMAGLAGYEPDGRINGSVKMDHIFNGLNMRSDLTASDVRLGKDTLGNIYVIGSYNGSKKIITLEPKSGIYRGDASIRTAGSMSFDSTSRQKLNGYIEFTNAQVAWLSPLVNELMSQLKGTVNGTVNIGGSAEKPDIDGSVVLRDGGTRIDILGTYYRIPEATVTVNNTSINFGTVTLYDVHNNPATLTGGLSHDRFRNIQFSRVRLVSPEFEVLNLRDYENSSFYGNLIANVDPMTITGTFDDIRMNITASPAAKSHIYIPVKTANDIGSYSYVSFKTYGKDQVVKKRRKNKFSLNITGKMNPQAEMTLVLDPAAGDAINAKGYGTITLNVPADDDIKMYGSYDIEEGDYTFTFRQLFFRRNFIINSGSKIAFYGPMSQTDLNINAIYTRKARLADLLEDKEKTGLSDNELRDAKTVQDVNVLLHMSGSLQTPKLTFNIDLPEKRSEGTFASLKLKRINQSERELFDQVASILLIGAFIPPEGLVGSTAATGAINNVSEILSTTASSQLTNIVNKLLGDQDLQVEFKYKNYNLSDASAVGGINRNEISLGVRKNLFKDRLIVELGSAYDWGRPTSTNSSTSNLNLAGDFRVQYLLTEDGRIRLNAFRTSNYDVLVDRNIWRGGVGISYRKSFDNLQEFFHRPKSVLDTKPVTPVTPAPADTAAPKVGMQLPGN
jgi:hypothetical protein